MWRFCVGALALLMLVPAARAQEETEKKVEPPTPAQQYTQLITEFRTQRQELNAEYQKADATERQALLEKSVTQANDIAEKFLALATTNPDDPIAANALQWIFEYAGTSPAASTAAKTMLDNAVKDPSNPKALRDVMTVATRTSGPTANEATRVLLELVEARKEDPAIIAPLTSLLMVRTTSRATADKVAQILVDNFSDNDELGMVCVRIAQNPQNQGTLRQVIEKTKNDSVKGHALFALATALAGRRLEPNKEAEELLTRVVTDFGDIQSYRGTLGKMAEGPLFEMQHLQIGMNVPNIEGEDVDGEAFQLADYKGKVVVLDFWGDW